MSRNSKQKQKVNALKVLGDMPDKEATALAKTSTLVRVKRKRVLLRGPKRRVLGSLVLDEDKMQFVFPQGSQIEQEGTTVRLTLPPMENGDGKKNKKKKSEKVDNPPEGQ